LSLATAATAATATSGATVLVVDDQEPSRTLLGEELAGAGFRIAQASDGDEGWQQFCAATPDIVVTDLQMPGMSGLELVSAVREQYPLMPIVLMTAQGSEEIAVAALQQGAANYVPKRILAEELVDTVARVLTASSIDRSHSRLLHRMKRSETEFDVESDLTLIPSLVHYLQ